MSETTAIILDQCGDGPILFFVVDGDYRHLDGVYINHMGCKQSVQDELLDLIYHPNTGPLCGQIRQDQVSKQELWEAAPSAHLIMCGFLP